MNRPPSSHRLLRAALLFFGAGVLAASGAAQNLPEAPAARISFCDGDRSPIACQDTLRALAVFVRFPDDDTDGPEWPGAAPDGTPIPRTQLPPFARDFLAATPEAAARTTPADSSLSAYFYWQSRNGPRGPHLLYGDVWPRSARGEPEAYVTAHPTRHYHNDQPGGRDAHSYGHLAVEVLDRLTAAPGFDLGDYDANRDGVLDHLFLLVKHDPAYEMQGWAQLSGYLVTAGFPPEKRVLRYWSPSRRDSIRVDWAMSGSVHVLKNWAQRGGIAHEYGHRLFGMPGHTAVIGPRDNDVPLTVPLDASGNPRLACAYNRMCGNPALYDEAAVTLAGSELRRMGWARRTVLDPTRDHRAVTLGPLYTHGEVVLIPLRPGAAGDTLSIESRQRTNFFDRYPPVDLARYGIDTAWRDLGTTGLLVTLTEGVPDGPWNHYRYDFLPPDNALRKETRCSGDLPACFGYDFYRGDMLHPDGATQLSPWTRPNVSGFTHYPEGTAANWFAVTAARYTGAADSTMAFDFVADVRDGFTITSDSWMGEETSGQTLAGRIVVAEGATLTVAAGAAVTFGAGLRVDEGARLVVEEGAAVRFGPGPRLDLRGTLEGAGFVEGR